MENFFDFDYTSAQLSNKDAEGSPSKFFIHYGQGGKAVNVKTSRYHMIDTASVSRLGHAFQNAGMSVTPYVKTHGEVIGLKATYGSRPTVVGQVNYSLILDIRNNGSGSGKLYVEEKRLVCSNGAVRTTKVGKHITIPHTFDYKRALELAEESISTLVQMIEEVGQKDQALNDITLTSDDAKYQLNHWFYHLEMPGGHRAEMTFNQFRELLVTDPGEIKSIKRYHSLMEAYGRELGYNEKLKLPLSMYTVFASVTNYLSRRRELSRSKDPAVVQTMRSIKKTKMFDELVALN